MGMLKGKTEINSSRVFLLSRRNPIGEITFGAGDIV